MPDLIVDLEQFQLAETQLIGHQAKQLAQLEQLGVRVLPSFVVPTSTLSGAIDHHRLAQLVETALANQADGRPGREQALNTVRRAIRTLELPKPTALAILKKYYQLCKQGYAAVMPSFHSAGQHSLAGPSTIRDNVHGDANLIETILECWASSLSGDSIETLTVTSPRLSGTDNALVPAAILIQCRPQPQASGTACNFEHHTGQSDVVTITAVKGVYDRQHHPDQHTAQTVLDKYTHATVRHRPARQHVQLSRRLDDYRQFRPVGLRFDDYRSAPVSPSAVLTSRQQRQLADIVNRLSSQHPGKICLDWQLVDDQVLVSHWQSLSGPTAGERQGPVIGAGVVPGVTAGRLHRVTPASRPHQVPPQCILFIDVHDRYTPQLVCAARGVLFSEPWVPPATLSLLTSRGVPTLSSVRPTKSLPFGQEVVLDAHTGRVTMPAKPARRLPPAHTQLYHYTQDLALAAPSDGVVFDSSALVLQAGTHPDYLWRTQAGQHVRLQLVRHLREYWPAGYPLWYLPFSPGPDLLAELDFGRQLEGDGPNPALGLSGAERIAAHPEWFEFELTAVKEVLNDTGADLQLVIPGVKQVKHLRRCWQLLERLGLVGPTVRVWAQLSSPRAVLDMGGGDRLPLAGVVLDADSVFSLSIGRQVTTPSDHEPEYTQVLTEYLKHLSQTLSPRQLSHPAHATPVVLQLSQHQPRLTAAAAGLGIRGVALPSERALELARQVVDGSAMLDNSTTLDSSATSDSSAVPAGSAAPVNPPVFAQPRTAQ
ncbi:MAG: hypothetical protein COU69_03015 [Candidatus Pacebacteria bacterium CG10_big_fil_rev_8_21_14_0_10_56_10]|nr:MAG: hypothetical protein COU69_03015 [Candidatus Pacebacteria bacterium CG10_big_fil_rev_8_21_14_0_10_56_10]